MAALAMASTPGYDDVQAGERASVHKDLSEAIRFSEIAVDSIMRKLGIPDALIPMLRAKMMAEMSTPEFWEEYNLERGGQQIELPPELQAALDRVAADRKKNGKI